MKNLRYLFEAALLHTLFFIFRLLPVDGASGAGGWLGRTIGPRMAASRKAERNLNRALPALSPEERKRVIAQMWDNLGRLLGEYPHLEHIGRERLTVKGENVLESVFKNKNGGIFFSAHTSNWEVFAPGMLLRYGENLDLTYRAPNNPYVDRLLQKARSLDGRIRTYSKSRRGGKELIEAVRNKHYIGILIDQKYNEGVAVPFFGMAAMTNPVFVQLCQKYGCPLIPSQNRRVKGARFEITVHEPLPLFGPDGARLPIEDVIAQAHAHLERWIRDDPGQWLWLHRRWDSRDI